MFSVLFHNIYIMYYKTITRMVDIIPHNTPQYPSNINKIIPTPILSLQLLGQPV